MAQNTNLHIISGNLTADPKVHTYTKPDGSAGQVTTLRVAVNRRPKAGGADGGVDYFDVKTFDGLARICEQYLTKGRQVLAQGRHQVDEQPRRDGNGKMYFHQILADSVEFLGSPRDDAGSSQNGSGAQAPQAAAAQSGGDDIPW